VQRGPSTKLAALLDHARRTSPYYATRLASLGERSAEDVLAGLPLLARSEVQREKARLWSSEGDSSTWRVVRTSGTTGEPLEVVLDEEARRVEALAFADHIDRCLGSSAWRDRTLFHLPLHVGAASGAMAAPWNADARVVKWNLIRAWQASDDLFLAALQHLDGHVVTTMPSVAELVASRLVSAGAAGSIVPLLIVLSGEMLDDAVRQQVEDAFGCPVTSLYTLAEAGVVGSECPTGGYHVEEQVAVVEILTEDARPAQAGAEGEVVITPLANRAMPLLRYRTGDVARWVDVPCGCGRPSGRFILSSGRLPVSLVSASGSTVNVIRFAKVIAALDVGRIELRGTGRGVVRVRYESTHALDLSARSVLESSLRSALGPTAQIAIERAPPERSAIPDRGASDPRVRPEPAGPSLPEIAAWLANALAEMTGVEAALITGSYLDPDATTRFSDIDAVVLLDDVPHQNPESWISLVRELRRSLPPLRVHVDLLTDLPARAPLVSCRLLQEQFPVLGDLSTSSLPWPSTDTLRRHGWFWAQEAEAALWSRLTDPALDRADPVRTGWLATKSSLDALRYLYLVRGERVTAGRAVLARALDDRTQGWPWIDDVSEAFDTAREHRPPPDIAGAPSTRYLTAALLCARAVSAGLTHAVHDQSRGRVRDRRTS